MMILDSMKGYLYLVGGFLLLLHTLGFLQRGFSMVLALVAIGVMAYGLKISGLYDFIGSLLQKKDIMPK